MENNEIDGKIAVTQKKIAVEIDQNKRNYLQKELQILNWKKMIISFKEKISNLRNGM